MDLNVKLSKMIVLLSKIEVKVIILSSYIIHLIKTLMI
jgi:hypothetical protein